MTTLAIDRSRLAAQLIGSDDLTVQSLPSGEPIPIPRGLSFASWTPLTLRATDRLEITRADAPNTFAGLIITTADDTETKQ